MIVQCILVRKCSCQVAYWRCSAMLLSCRLGAAQLVAAAALAAALQPARSAAASCPDDDTLARNCGGARHASAGNCLVCMATHHTGCDSARADGFCVNRVAPTPGPPAGFALVDSHIAGAMAEGLAFVEGALPTRSQGQQWALCYDSRSDCTVCASAAFTGPMGSSSCACDWPAPKRSFHDGCDNHTTTLVLGHNSLGFTFGAFAQESWGGHSWAREAPGDFLFRLGPGVAAAYRPTGSDTYYQLSAPGRWPTWGSSPDLCFGKYDTLGTGTTSSVGCHQGGTYEGEPNDVCGGKDGQWGATEMEVWYRVGGEMPVLVGTND